MCKTGELGLEIGILWNKDEMMSWRWIMELWGMINGWSFNLARRNVRNQVL